jgi:hypothetical protein
MQLVAAWQAAGGVSEVWATGSEAGRSLEERVEREKELGPDYELAKRKDLE